MYQLLSIVAILFVDIRDMTLARIFKDAELYLAYLHSLCEMGGAMKSVMSDALMDEEAYESLTKGIQYYSTSH